MKESMEETEEVYKKQINELINKYTSIVTEKDK